jgi:hypothetical protein
VLQARAVPWIRGVGGGGLEDVQGWSAAALRLTKGPSSPVVTLADAPALVPPAALRLPALRDVTAAQVGFATFALLAAGLLLSIATTPDPHWWHLHFSRLGTFPVFSGYAFNATIVLTSAGVVLFAARLRVEMRRHAGTAVLVSRRSATVVPILIALLGIHLSVVGFVPVNLNEFLHDRGSTGAVFSFIAVLASSRWTLRGMHGAVARASRRVGAGLVATIAPYIGGFINLAAFELIVFTLVFWWLLLFARSIGRPADPPPQRTSARTGSIHQTIVVAPPAHPSHVAVATRGPVPARGLRPTARPRHSIRAQRRISRSQTPRQLDPEHRISRAAIPARH